MGIIRTSLADVTLKYIGWNFFSWMIIPHVNVPMMKVQDACQWCDHIVAIEVFSRKFVRCTFCQTVSRPRRRVAVSMHRVKKMNGRSLA